MCFNKEVSLIVFIFGLFASIKLFLDANDNNKLNAAAIYVFSVSLMQLVEFFLWHYNNPKTFSHQFWSMMIAATLCLQVILVYYASVEFLNINMSGEKKDYFITLTVLLVSYLCIFLYLFLNSFKYFGLFDSRPTICNSRINECRLTWSIQNFFKKENMFLHKLMTLIYLVGCGLMTYLIFGYPAVIILFSLLAIIFLINGKKSIESLWCFSVVIITICVLLFKSDDIMHFSPLI